MIKNHDSKNQFYSNTRENGYEKEDWYDKLSVCIYKMNTNSGFKNQANISLFTALPR